MSKFIGHITVIFGGEESGNRMGYKDAAGRSELIAYVSERFEGYQIYISDQEVYRLERRRLARNRKYNIHSSEDKKLKTTPPGNESHGRT